MIRSGLKAWSFFVSYANLLLDICHKIDLTLFVVDFVDVYECPKYVYFGEAILNSQENYFSMQNLKSLGSGQDVTYYGDYWFIFSSTGIGKVYDKKNHSFISEFILDKKDIILPHCNSICFGNKKYVEKDVEVVFLTSISDFIGKILGHFLTFFCLGLGLSCFFFFLTRPRKLALLYIFITILAYSSLTELFQSSLFNNNRGASITDVFFNTIWGLLGCSLFFIILAIYIIISKAIDKDSYLKTKKAIGDLSFKTFFKK